MTSLPTPAALLAPGPCTDPAATWLGALLDAGACGTDWVGGFMGVWLPILFACAVLGGVAWEILKRRS